MADAVAAGAPPRPAGRRTRCRSNAFGLHLELGFHAPALPPSQVAGAPEDITTVELVASDALDAAWPPDSRRTGLMGPEERPHMVVHEHPEAGYRIELPPYGSYHVSADGLSIACAPPPRVPAWDWQRLLIGQVLPAAAALRGYEVLHASAVELGRGAIAFAGPPGLGKSSLAMRMVKDGAGLLAEDVLAVTERGGRVIAEPGAALLNLREDEARNVGELATELGRSEGKTHFVAHRTDEARELSVLYLLEPGTPGQDTFEAVDAPTARDVMANSFVLYVLRPERMLRQLEIAAAVARSVRLVRLRVKAGVDSKALASQVEEHAAKWH
jgi:hypothetical protein